LTSRTAVRALKRHTPSASLRMFCAATFVLVLDLADDLFENVAGK
jgi:hypothetical protein